MISEQNYSWSLYLTNQKPKWAVSLISHHSYCIADAGGHAIETTASAWYFSIFSMSLRNKKVSFELKECV